MSEATPDDGFDRLQRMQAAARRFPDVAWFLRQVDRWVEDGSVRPLEAYLRLPTTPRARQRYQRDRWLARAAAEVPGPGGIWSRAVVLAAEMEDFVLRGSFARWRAAGGPPRDATRLRKALYHALALNGGRCLGPDRLVQIEVVSSVFMEKIDSTSPNIPASESLIEDTDAS